MGTQSTSTEIQLGWDFRPALDRPRECTGSLMSQVKHSFDPTGILNPGKILSVSSERRD
ncbi:FAD-linked oxidase C-terminal domain-containing protein [Limnohabitans planktonicus]|uniref:FAD-linked oxidase C-terminal domain-containing protein n=1 Tax=Limnohabitans planktonicus TaxID=540060 RepID=UPI000E320C43